ncbi:hypothetical protein PHYPO_G00124880 [Pangasianodon hypophthalmus]|uniref:Uncharacterized protein n=1 Tax=Pangasianodon hypophthalmus TaxID=310915 RepID=A0A5N5KRU2_PANHP|nr:hypothetical protein PHYPO_G00124880 [Pangasianodon hypophthalmus]
MKVKEASAQRQSKKRQFRSTKIVNHEKASLKPNSRARWIYKAAQRNLSRISSRKTELTCSQLCVHEE